MKDTSLIYRNFIEGVKTLPPAERAEAYEAYFSYTMDDEEYTGSNPTVKALMMIMKSQMDKDKSEYEVRKEKSRNAANARWHKHNDASACSSITDDAQNADIDIDNGIDIKEKDSKESKKKAAAFIPPTVEEVKAYCDERHNNVNPIQFVDFYSGKGWMVGKNKMKDWRACVRTWEQRNKDGPPLKQDVKAGITRNKDLDSWLNDKIIGGLK